MLECLQKKWFLYIAGVAFFLALVRYKGFDDDAALYLLQVVDHLHPERFLNDVPFMFGNQDSFSIFSPIVACVYRLLGVNAGGQVMTFLMLVAWGAFAIMLVVKWAERFGLKRWTALLVVVFFSLLLNKCYHSGNLFLPMMEPYLVARVFSEVIVLAGLACLFSKNKFVSLVFFAFATLMHPLMGGWTLPLWLFFHYPRARISIVAVSLILPLSGFLHVGPLDFYPQDWRPMYYAPGLDEFIEYSGLLVFWFFMYRKLKGSVLSKFSLSLLLVSFIGFYLQFSGSYFVHELFYQAQPFRVQWLSLVSVIPVFAIYLHGILTDGREFSAMDYCGVLLGMCAISNEPWVYIVSAITMLTVFLFKRCSRTPIKQLWINTFFVVSLLFLIASSVLGNFVQLALEQGLGGVSHAVSWIAIPEKMAYVEKALLVLLVLVCITQRRLWVAFALAVSFCNPDLKIMAIVAILFYLVPNINPIFKKILIALTITISFAELLASLDECNAIQSAPLQGHPMLSVVFLSFLFVFLLWVLMVKNSANSRFVLAPLFCTILLLGWWNACVWDARDDSQADCERQMDAFFETPIFPQVADRGKILFAVENEVPMQSRINFLTGAYADASIYVGEIFYYNQYMESNRRRSMLLKGDSVLADMAGFNVNIMNVYQNPDTLLARVRFLCNAGEIMHFVSDSGKYPLPLKDSVYLDQRKIRVYLYECEGE